jgi:hypothetical protein
MPRKKSRRPTKTAGWWAKATTSHEEDEMGHDERGGYGGAGGLRALGGDRG